MRISPITVLAAILALCVAESKDRKERSGDGYYYPRGTPGGWDSRNGVQSFGWDSRRPTNPCARCSQTPPENYRGNGYDNLSPEWQQQKEAKPWRPGYEDKRVWSGTIRPIENPSWDQGYDRWDSARPGGMVTNWMGGPSRWETYQRRDPWEKGYQQPSPSYGSSTPSYGSGYAGGYGYNDDRYNMRGHMRPGYDAKNPVYYDRSRGESGYISRYDYNYQPWEETMRGWGSGGWGVKNYATSWDYERPGHGYGGYHMREPPTSMSFTPLAPPYPDPWTERGPQNRPGVGTWTRPYEKPGYDRRPDYYDQRQERPWRPEGYRPDGYRPEGYRPDPYRPEYRPMDGYRPDGYRPDDFSYRPDDRYRPSGEDRYRPGDDRYGYRPNEGGYGYPYERPSRPGSDYGGSPGTDHKLDRYPGHTGVGATYDFYGSREPGSYHYDRPTTSSTPTTTDRSTSLSSTSSSTTS